MFVGYPKSGHTLIRAMLDAHPNITISHELNVLELVERDKSAKSIYERIEKNSKRQAAAGNLWQTYDYGISGQSQGHSDPLHVIGDKKGGRTALMLHSFPGLLSKLQRIISLPIKMIHVIRNPYDTVASLYDLESHKENSLEQNITIYGRQLKGVLFAKDRLGSVNVMDVRHERFVADPSESMRGICRFLGVDASDDYLNAVCSIVQPQTPSRNKITWTDEAHELLEAEISHYSWLKDYRFEE
jgi:hypothetical protein